MTVREVYAEAIKGKHKSLILLIDYLVKERKVLELTDDEEKLQHFIQDKYKEKMNEYLSDYEVKK